MSVSPVIPATVKICSITDEFIYPTSFEVEETAYHDVNGTVFNFPLIDTNPAGNLTYKIISPTTKTFTSTNSRRHLASGTLSFLSTDTFIGETISVTMEASRNASFFLWITKTFNVKCLSHCEYCSDLSVCTKCKPAYYYMCEELKDGDLTYILLCAWLIKGFMILFFLS